jgi:hypothetical protein
VEEHLKDKMYEEAAVPQWVNYICEDVVQGLAELGKPFKYVGACRSRRPKLGGWAGAPLCRPASPSATTLPSPPPPAPQ